MTRKGVKGWRVVERKASIWQKLNRKHEFTRFNRIEKGLLLAVVMIAGTLTFAFGYYSLNVAPFLPGGSQQNDPFTQIWNGSITGLGTSVGATTIAYQQSVAPTANAEDGNGGGLGDQYYEECFNTNSQSSFTLSRIDLTVKIVGSPTGTIIGEVWNNGVLNNVNGSCAFTRPAGQTAFGSSISISTVGTSYQTITFTGSYSVIPTGSNSFAYGIKYTCASCDSSNYLAVGIVSIGTAGTSTENGYINTPNDSGNCATPTFNAGCPTAYKYQYALYASQFCPAGYHCQNSYGDASNLLNLVANSTYPGITISSSPIDFSAVAAKELFWFETWNNASNYVAQPIGWFLTTNQTLPTQAGYNPLNDNSVVMANVLYPLTANKNIYYNYQAKTPGQSLLTASGAGTNPYPNCGQSSTLYICAQATINGGGFRDFSMTMNYTGTANAGGHNGASLTCNESTPGPGPNTYDFCLAAYAPSPCTGTDYAACSTRVFPYLNVNNGPYYIGYWTAAGQTGRIQFGTSNSGSFDRRANMAFIWVPNPCSIQVYEANCVGARTEPNGFLGWLGRIATVYVDQGLGSLGALVAPVQKAGGDLMNAVYAALVIFISYMINGFKIVFDTIGNALGLGNLGTELITVLSNIAASVVDTFSTIASFFQLAAQFIISTYFDFVQGSVIIWNGIVTILLTFWGLIAPASWNVSVLLFLYYGYGMLKVYKRGMRGLWSWLLLTKFIFTFAVEFTWLIFNQATRGFIVVKNILAGWL